MAKQATEEDKMSGIESTKEIAATATSAVLAGSIYLDYIQELIAVLIGLAILAYWVTKIYLMVKRGKSDSGD